MRGSFSFVFLCLVGFLVACGGAQQSKQDPDATANAAPPSPQNNCQGIHCGECPPAITVLLIDPDTGREIGWDAVVPAAKIVGEDGTCNTFGECNVLAKDDSTETEYKFDVVFEGEVVKSIVTTAEQEPAAECCNCGYTTRVIRIKVDV